MIQGAIFDLDGTLLDSMYIWKDAGPRFLKTLGLDPILSQKDPVQGMSLLEAATRYQEVYGLSMTVEEIMQGINRAVERYYREEVNLKPGVKELLTRLHEAGVSLCVATLTDRYLVEIVLERCEVLSLFSEIFTGTSVGKGKDDPKIYREAQKHMESEKTRTLVFEDSLYALQTAKKDGFLTVAVYDDHEKAQDTMKSTADYYLTDFRDPALWNFAVEH